MNLPPAPKCFGRTVLSTGGETVEGTGVRRGLWNWPDHDLAALERTGARVTIMNGYPRGRLADDEGMVFTLENLNQRDHPGCPFRSTRAVLAMDSAADRPQLRINLDLYHNQFGEGDPVRWCQACLPWIAKARVADNPGRCETARNVPVYHTCDVLVVGGGPAETAAACVLRCKQPRFYARNPAMLADRTGRRRGDGDRGERRGQPRDIDVTELQTAPRKPGAVVREPGAAPATREAETTGSS